MGSSASRPSALAPTFARLASWDMKAAKRLLAEYREKDLDFGLDAQALAEICSGDNAWAEAIIDAFGGTNGIINALAYICGAILVSSGAALEKAGLVFDALDFDVTEQISMDEMSIVFLCCARGYCVMSATGTIPTDEALENVTLQAYRELSKSGGHSITKAEFTKWVLKFIGAAPTAVPHADVSLEDMALQFGLVPLPPAKSLAEEVLEELAAENNAPSRETAEMAPPEETPVADHEPLHNEAPKEDDPKDAEEESLRTPDVVAAQKPNETPPEPSLEPTVGGDDYGDEFPAEMPRPELAQRPPSSARGDVASEVEAHLADDVNNLPLDHPLDSEPEIAAAVPSQEDQPDVTSVRAEPARETTPRDLNAYETYDHTDRAFDASSGLEPPDPLEELSRDQESTEPVATLPTETTGATETSETVEVTKTTEAVEAEATTATVVDADSAAAVDATGAISTADE